MIRKIPYHLATRLLIMILSGLTLFHLLIITEIIYINRAWDSQTNSMLEMYLYEGSTIAMNLFVLTIVCMNADYIKRRYSKRLGSALTWQFVLMFLFNTAGHMYSENSLEQILLAPVSLLLTLLFWRIAIDQRTEK